MKKHAFIIVLMLISYCSFSQKLPSIKATVYDSSLTGYYFVSCNYSGGSLFMILDHVGDPLYCKPMGQGTSAYNFSLNPNGLISYSDQKKYIFMDSTFNLVDSVACKNLYKTDPHDMKLLPDGHYLLLGADLVTMNLSSDPVCKEGYRDDTTLVRRAVVQELDQNKNVVFEWHAKDHFSFDAVDTFLLMKPSGMVDLEHINSVEADADGNILLSSRVYSEITKINRKDGSVMWRLGGKRNQFTFVNCPVPFYGQHDIRRLSNGHITLFDGGHHSTSHGARALEFELDEVKKVATLKWSYVYDSAMISMGRGNVERLADGNTLVNFGGISNNKEIVFVVVDSLGHKIFQLSSPDHLDSYRSFYYPSLPWQVHRPTITCFDSLGVSYLKTTTNYSSYKWSDLSLPTGQAGTTAIIPVTKPGKYAVFVPYGKDSFVSSEKFIVTNSSNPCGDLPEPKRKESSSKKQ